MAFWRHHNLPFNYDISACAPTILIQLAHNVGMLELLQGPIHAYINNKDSMRARIAEELGISRQHAKQILNSLFNGARLAKNNFCAIYRDLPGPPVDKNRRMEWLQSDVEISLLKTAIDHAWWKIGRKLDVNTKKGAVRWNIYFTAERTVLNSIVRYLDEKGLQFFTEHDGFRSSGEVDTDELSGWIKDKTGYDLQIEREEETPLEQH
ncbi:hypothetical protein DBA29_20335 [Xenophilus aerolatus]|nr:hypothetical protein [Xenophilus aerolatus]